MTSTIRIELPSPLCKLAGAPREVQVSVEDAVTLRSVLDALEIAYPKLEGTIRDHTSKHRRPFIRFFACEEDISNSSSNDLLPQAVTQGKEPLLIIGAIAGG